MKLFNSARPDGPAENSAAEVRLNSIVERGQAERCLYGTHPPPQKVDAIQASIQNPGGDRGGK